MAAPKVPAGCPLTPREFEVLQLYADGLRNEEIASELNLSLSTIRTHTQRMYRKLGCKNRTQAVAGAGRLGWIGWIPSAQQPAAPAPTPGRPVVGIAAEHPFLAAYLAEFERSRWPHAPDASTALGMKLALAGHRNQIRSSPKEGA